MNGLPAGAVGDLLPAAGAIRHHDGLGLRTHGRQQRRLGAEDGGGTRETFSLFIASEQAKWARVVKEGNVRVET